MDPTLHFKHLSARQMMVIPVTLAIFMGAVTIAALALDTFPVGRDLRGGTLVMVRGLDNAPNVAEVETIAEIFLGAEADVRITEDRALAVGRFGLDIETDNFLEEDERGEFENILSQQLGISGDMIRAEGMGGALIGIHREQARNAIIGAAVAMAIVIFIVFRHRVTVGAILLTVGLNMVGIFGCMSLFRVDLSLASIAGLLMLIGYSVDTNILLSSRVLKGVTGEAHERAASAMKTGLMMSGTSLIVLLALNLFTTAPALDQLSAVLIFGIVIDVFNTWFLNAGFLLRYMQKRMRREHYVSI
jgi:preprotein translocase subunit SecF